MALAAWSALLRIVLPVGLAIVVPGLLLAGLIMSGDPDGPSPRTAVIVDQLGLGYPNLEFVASATDLLGRGGYEVDYIGGAAVTVDLYREIAERDDEVVIFRTHVARDRNEGVAGLFTSEPYSEGRYGDPGVGWVTTGGDDRYFGIGPDFVASGMEGSFDGALVVLMGCNGLEIAATAEAFVARGAGAVVGWSDEVTAEHTDVATERLLEKLLDEDLPLSRAVVETREEVGPDPYFGGELRLLAGGE